MMKNIIVYSTPQVLTLVSEFNFDYFCYGEDVDNEEYQQYLETKEYSPGDTILAVAMVESDTCVTGYGYIVYDEELQESFIADIGLFGAEPQLN